MNPAALGFFGKVSSHGDFVSRRLPPDFVQVWDNWLQQCLHTSRQQLGPAWLAHYLSSPIWRFALDKGVIDQHAWAGVLIPSVDRVGRHFPLMIAGACQGRAPLLQWLSEEKAWFDQLEKWALASLEDGFMLSEFDAALAAMNALPAMPDGIEDQTKPDGFWCLPIGSLAQVPAGMPALTSNIAQSLLQGHSLWWTEGSPSIQASLLVRAGLPATTSFAAMLDGQWAALDRDVTLP